MISIRTMRHSRGPAIALTSVLAVCCVLVMVYNGERSVQSQYSDSTDGGGVTRRAGAQHRRLTKDRIIPFLASLAAVEPLVQANSSCRPVQLPTFPQCAGHSGLTGRRRSHPARIVMMFLFSYEVDVLEIALHEAHDIVDKIVIVESSMSHRGNRKPLMWERLKWTERFQQFFDGGKVVHVVADDFISDDWKIYQWQAELDMTRNGVDRVKLLMGNWGFSADEDVIFLSGNVDEILSRSVLHQLRHCELVPGVVFGGLIMNQGDVSRAFWIDDVVNDGPHAYLQPSIYNWRDVMEEKQNGMRIFDKNEVYANRSNEIKTVKGGSHLTGGSLLPNAVLKEISASEEQFYKAQVNWQYLLSMEVEDIDLEQQRVHDFFYKPFFIDRFENTSVITDMQPYIPWFLDCNKERYPYWFGRKDPRNEVYFQKIVEFGKSINFVRMKLCPHLFGGAMVTCFFEDKEQRCKDGQSCSVKWNEE